MTTYELPPEPPIGTKVHPSRHPDVVWYRSGRDGGWSTPGRPWYSWAQLLGKYEGQGLTLIEPDPWPTAPLIVATREGKGRRLMGAYSLTSRDYADITGMRAGEVDDMAIHHREPLTNVVPVTVVPVAEMRHAREMLAAADAGDFDSFIGSFRKLVAATDALGLDQ